MPSGIGNYSSSQKREREVPPSKVKVDPDQADMLWRGPLRRVSMTVTCDFSYVHDVLEVELFLRELRPEGPWTLVAIRPDPIAQARNTQTRTFPASDLAELHSFIAKWNTVNRWGIYVAINPLRSAVQSVPRRTDVQSVEYLHGDVDPREGHRLKSEQRRIRAQFDRRKQPPKGIPGHPTFLIFSGGGYQALWGLSDAVEIDGNMEVAEKTERYTRHIETVFGGDTTHNINRVARLPGTINHPSDKKRKRGQAPTRAKLVEHSRSRNYRLEQFQEAEPKQSAYGVKSPDSSANLKKLKRLDDLDRWDVPKRLKKLISKGRNSLSPKDGDDSRSAWLFDCICNLLRYGVPTARILGIITDKRWKISESVLDKANPHTYALRQIEQAIAIVGTVLDPSDPLACARIYRASYRPHCIYYKKEYLDYVVQSGCYQPLEVETIRAEIYQLFEKSSMRSADGKIVSVRPDSTLVNKVLDAFQAFAHVAADRFTPPCWLAGSHTDLDETDIVVCSNGLLHVPSRSLYPHTPNFFTRTALEIAYDPSAPEPKEMMRFLRSLFPEGMAEIELFQEIVGYLVSGKTNQQKIFVIVGPTRAGKGTIGNTLRQLVGAPNTTSPSGRALSTQFGLESMIGKSLALMSDAVFPSRSDALEPIVENLKRISGEDPVNVPRKWIGDWVGRLDVRFLILSNEIPSLPDPSGALPNRLIPLVLTESFLGREDLDLSRKIAKELSGLLNWALLGLERLRERGRFELPHSSKAALVELVTESSPVAAFVQACCHIDKNARVPKDQLYRQYGRWRKQNGGETCAKSTFFKQLFSAVPSARPKRESDEGVRKQVIVGLRLRRKPP